MPPLQGCCNRNNDVLYYYHPFGVLTTPERVAWIAHCLIAMAGDYSTLTKFLQALIEMSQRGLLIRKYEIIMK